MKFARMLGVNFRSTRLEHARSFSQSKHHNPGRFSIGEERGRGTAKLLCSSVFEFAEAEGLRVFPSCSYVANRFVPSHLDEWGDKALQFHDSDTPGLEIEVSGLGVARLRLTDARRRNPLTLGILQRMREFLISCAVEHPPSPVRSIVIESTGPAWSSGHDFKDFHQRTREEQAEVLDVCAEVNIMLGTLPQVTLAAVAGKCWAGGAQLAASCDIVLAHAELATFCLPGTRDHGFCHTPSVAVAARVYSSRKAFELAVLAPEISALEAERVGLANRAIPGDEFVQSVEEVAVRLARWYNPNMSQGKKTFYEQVTAPTPEAKYAIATPVMLDMFNSPEQKQKMHNFLTKKKKK